MIKISNQQETILNEKGDFPRIYSLIRFFRAEHVEDFRSGHIRLGSVRSYRENYQDEPGKKNDDTEFLSDLHQPDKVTIEINELQLKGICSPVKIRRNLDHCSYLLCMSAITDRFLNEHNGVQRFSPDLLALGQKAVFIIHVDEFIRRINEAVLKTDHFFSYPEADGRISGLVEYVDFNSYHGQIGPFRKSYEYAFQLEWRVALVYVWDDIGPYPDHIFLEVGDLSDIMSTVDSSELFDGEIRVTVRENTNPKDL